MVLIWVGKEPSLTQCPCERGQQSTLHGHHFLHISQHGTNKKYAANLSFIFKKRTFQKDNLENPELKFHYKV